MKNNDMKNILLYLSLFLSLLSCNKPVTGKSGEEGIKVEEIVWDGVKRADITYQLLVYSFADGDGDLYGDFKGLKDRLDYIDALGASAIWLSPIHPSEAYHGYGVIDYERVNEKFGTEKDFKDFLDAAHARGIKVYLDFVLNHSATDCEWFKQACAGNPEYKDFYIFSENPKSDISAGKIPTIASEGAAGYNASEWRAARIAGVSENLKFTLDWNSTPPSLKVEKVSDISNTGTKPSGKYLWWGEGNCTEFYSQTPGVYTLSLAFKSDWGCLVRTSNTSWDNGTKYGAPSGSNILEWGVPLPLSNSDNADISLPGAQFFHSHFRTDAFADFNFGAAAESEKSGAFKALAKAADKWIALGVDGFRLDAVKHIYHNMNGTENAIFLKKFYDHCNASYKASGHEDDIYMVGEVFEEANIAAPYYAGLPSLFEFSFWFRLQWALNNGVGRYFYKDINSYHTAYKAVREGAKAATKLSNHDEDRAGSSLGKSLEKEKLAAAVLLTMEGSPYIYQGEELGYYGTKERGDEWVRTPVKWTRTGAVADAALNGKVDKEMLSADISVEAQEADKESLLNVYRKFAILRNAIPALAVGDMQEHAQYNQNSPLPSIAAWYRSTPEQKVLVMHNFSGKEVKAELSDELSKPLAVNGKVVIEGSSIALGPYSTIILEQ